MAAAAGEEGFWDLTSMQAGALSSGHNLSDAHNRMDLPSGLQQRMSDGLLLELWQEATARPYHALLGEFLASFGRATGQGLSGNGTAIYPCYAASVAMSVLAMCLAALDWSVSVIHPTFDNIPDLLKSAGVRLLPLSESTVRNLPLRAPEADCVFLTLPNNPTGLSLSGLEVEGIMRWAAEAGTMLIIDRSFAMFEGEAPVDYYGVAARHPRLTVCFIEDTGKSLPSLDQKLGLLTLPESTGLRHTPLARELRHKHSQVLLNVSPFTLALLREFYDEYACGALSHMLRALDVNRGVGRQLLLQSGFTLPRPESRVSVDVFDTSAHGPAADVAESLRILGVDVLPCDKFYWATPGIDSGWVRIALARRATDFADAIAALCRILRDDD